MGTSQSPGWFVRTVDEVIEGLDGMKAYLDDFFAFDDSRQTHIRTMHAFLQRV